MKKGGCWIEKYVRAKPHERIRGTFTGFYKNGRIDLFWMRKQLPIKMEGRYLIDSYVRDSVWYNIVK